MSTVAENPTLECPQTALGACPPPLVPAGPLLAEEGPPAAAAALQIDPVAGDRPTGAGGPFRPRDRQAAGRAPPDHRPLVAEPSSVGMWP